MDRLTQATPHLRPAQRLAGTLALAGAALMLAGAGIWASTGTDIDVALVTGTMDAYLADAAEHRGALVANLTLWLVGALTLGAAGIVMAGLTGGGSGPGFAVPGKVGPRHAGIEPLSGLARYAFTAGAILAATAFLAWLAVILNASAAAEPAEVGVARVVGWFAYRADGVATALIVGAGPALVSSAGRDDWVPRWLFRWALVAAAAGVASFLPYFVPALPLGLTLVIVPVGLGWTIAGGVVLLRRTGTGRGTEPGERAA